MMMRKLRRLANQVLTFIAILLAIGAVVIAVTEVPVEVMEVPGAVLSELSDKLLTILDGVDLGLGRQ